MNLTIFRPWYMSFIESIVFFVVWFRVFSGSGTFWKTLVIMDLFEMQNCTNTSEITLWMEGFPRCDLSNILPQDKDVTLLSNATILRSIQRLDLKLCIIY